MASHSGTSITNNGRKSKPKYRGIKISHLEKVNTGSIILLQKGTKYISGNNTFLAKNHSIHAGKDGWVFYFKKNIKNLTRTIVSVITEKVEKIKP